MDFRLQQLHALQKMISEKEADISSALKQDINRVKQALPCREPARLLVLLTFHSLLVLKTFVLFPEPVRHAAAGAHQHRK